jgi:L-lysine 6-transaminase
MLKVASSEVFNVLEKSILADGFDMVLDIEKSLGARLYDSKNKRTVVDFFSFFASNPLGFNHPRMSDKDFEAKLLKHAKVKVSNSDIYTTALAEFVQTFHQNVAPQFQRLFFVEGGALGVENAIKTAQDWKVRKNLKAGKGEKGTQVLHFKEAFHGRTGYTMSLTNTSPEKVMYFPKFDWPRVTNPKVTFPCTGENLKKVEALEAQSLGEIKAAFEERPDEIAAIVMETIQGEGGDNFFRPEFLKKVKELSHTYDALLIFDEVQAGMGITGRFWAWENFGVQPDLMAFGKKVQVCGFAAQMDRLNEVDNVFKVPSRINSTWGGNLVDMVRTTQFIDIIVEEKLLAHVTQLGKSMLQSLQDMAHSDERITNPRGLGLWMAFDMPNAEIRNAYVDKCFEKGVVVLSCGQRSVRLRPVLNLQESEAAEGLDLMRKALQDIHPQSQQGKQAHGG